LLSCRLVIEFRDAQILDKLLGRLVARDMRHEVSLHQPINVHENAKEGFRNGIALKTHLSEIEDKTSREAPSNFLFFNQDFIIGKDRDEIMAVLSFLLEFCGNTRQDARGKGPQARVNSRGDQCPCLTEPGCWDPCQTIRPWTRSSISRISSTLVTFQMGVIHTAEKWLTSLFPRKESSHSKDTM
jgi:hypothetical protein